MTGASLRGCFFMFLFIFLLSFSVLWFIGLAYCILKALLILLASLICFSLNFIPWFGGALCFFPVIAPIVFQSLVTLVFLSNVATCSFHFSILCLEMRKSILAFKVGMSSEWGLFLLVSSLCLIRREAAGGMLGLALGMRPEGMLWAEAVFRIFLKTFSPLWVFWEVCRCCGRVGTICSSWRRIHHE